MPSPAALKYFNSFNPGQQETIRASWQGQDMMDQWFQAAQAAGAVDQGGTPNQGQGATEASAAAGGMTPEKLRQKARQEGWSEDFARYQGPQGDRVLQGWINQYWDPQRGKFRSMHAPQGAQGDWVYAEKPDEGIVDPQGTEWGPHGNRSGVNLSALGLNTLHGSVGAGGRTGGGRPQGQPQPQPVGAGLFDPQNPLQNKLIQMVQQGGGFFGQNPMNNAASLQGGGVWWGQGGDFSQAFDPLKPKGNKRPRRPRNNQPFQQQENPFQQAAQPVTTTPNSQPTNPGFVAQQPQQQGNPMQQKLFKMYGGNNTHRTF